MADNRLTLARLIVNKTRSGELPWTESDGGDFQFAVGKNIVVLAAEEEGFSSDDLRMVIRVYGPNASLVESFNDKDLQGLENGPWLSLLMEAHGAARRRALGADKLLDEIVAELTKDDPRPTPSKDDDDIPF